MPGIVRGFRQLARNLGRVGIGQETFTSPKTIQPTLDAEQYSPLGYYGLNMNGVAAGPANVWHVMMFVPQGITVTELTILTASTLEYYYWVPSSAGIPTPGVVIPHSLCDGTASQVDVERSVGLPTASPPRPANTFRFQPLSRRYIRMPPVVGPTRVNLEQILVNQALNVDWSWREVTPVA